MSEMERIFARSFLATTPARIFEWIDVRREEVETSSASIIEGTSLGAYNGGDGFDEVIIKGCT